MLHKVLYTANSQYIHLFYVIYWFARRPTLLASAMAAWRVVRTRRCVKAEKRWFGVLTAYLRLPTVSSAWRGDRGALQGPCVGLEGRNQEKIAVEGGRVESIVNDKLVGQLYPAIVQGHVDKPAVEAVKQHPDPQRARPPLRWSLDGIFVQMRDAARGGALS